MCGQQFPIVVAPLGVHSSPMRSVNLIVAADEPAIFFASVNEAERWMEPVDVQEGVYTAAYGPEGEPFMISTDGRRVTIRETGGKPEPDILREILLRYFATIREPADGAVTLPELLERCHPSYR